MAAMLASLLDNTHHCVYTVYSPQNLYFSTSDGSTDRSATYDFLLMLHSIHEPYISYRFRDKWRFHSKVAIFPIPVYLTPPAEGRNWNWVPTQRVKKLE